MAATWKIPPMIKVYEALGCVADLRIVTKEHAARVRSSVGNKTYRVTYDPKARSIMSNDNGAYWQGYLGYPAIAFLFKKGLVSYDRQVAADLKGIPWKAINTRHNNNFAATIREVQHSMTARQRQCMMLAGHDVMDQLKQLRLTRLGPRIQPPKERGKRLGA